MKRVLELKAQIQSLMRELAINSLNRARMGAIGNPIEVERCNLGRIAILQSIAHRQGQIIEILSQEVEYKQEEAA